MDLLDWLLNLPDPNSFDWTEADTRAQFIDPMIDRLGWPPSEIKREPYAGWTNSNGHYSAPEIEELLEASNRVCSDGSRKTPALTLLKRKTA